MDYKNYFLSENPFPDGVVNPYSANPKINGEIFAEEARKETIKEFEDIFINAPNFDDRERIGWLWAKSETEFEMGRGMGKTALLVYFKHKINKNWGFDYTKDESKKFCAVYVHFDLQIKDYPLEHICLIALRSCIQDGIYSEIRTNASYDQLTDMGVNAEFATRIMNGTIEEYLKSFRSDRELTIPRPPRDTLLLKKTANFFLNQTVLALKAAGFIGGLLFIDDIENFTDIPGYKYLQIFAKNFGNAFLRGGFGQARERLFSSVLTTHLTSATKFSSAWRACGMESAYPLAVEGPSSIEVPVPDMESSHEIIKAYLNYFRIPGSTPPSTFHPFTLKAVNEVISINKKHPRKFLADARRVMLQALRDERKIINSKYVKRVLKVEEAVKPEVPELEEI